MGLRDRNSSPLQVTDHSDPNLAKFNMIIDGVESEFDQRTKHSWGHLTQVTEVHNLMKIYQWGRGMPIHMHHRDMREIDEKEGDKMEWWDGTKWNDDPQWRVNYVPEHGKIYLKLRLWWYSRYSRLRVTYRYGTMEVPSEIKFAILGKVCAQLLTSSLSMEAIQFGKDRGITMASTVEKWEETFDRTVAGWEDFSIVGY